MLLMSSSLALDLSTTSIRLVAMSSVLVWAVAKSAFSSKQTIPGHGSFTGAPLILPCSINAYVFLLSHIDWHLEAGFAVVFAEDPAGIVDGPKSVIIPDAWKQLCPAYLALPPEFQ
jgi:hypothetical protein